MPKRKSVGKDSEFDDEIAPTPVIVNNKKSTSNVSIVTAF